MNASAIAGRAVLVGVLLAVPGAGADSASPGLPVRFGLTEEVFQNLNENDARAAVRVWARSLAQSAHLGATSPALMRSDEIVRAITNHELDGFSITVPEYMRVEPFVDPVILSDEGSARNGIQYLLLVRQNSGIEDVAGLRGRSLCVYKHPSMALASEWLDLLLAAAKLEPAERLCRLKVCLKVSETVLPVFFDHADACLVTRRAFETMVELNPDLQRKLKIVAVSPALLTVFFAMHKETSSEIKSRLREALLAYYDQPDGRQILTLFQSGRLVTGGRQFLRNSVELQTAYNRLKAGSSYSGKPQPIR